MFKTPFFALKHFPSNAHSLPQMSVKHPLPPLNTIQTPPNTRFLKQLFISQKPLKPDPVTPQTPT